MIKKRHIAAIFMSIILTVGVAAGCSAGTEVSENNTVKTEESSVAAGESDAGENISVSAADVDAIRTMMQEAREKGEQAEASWSREDLTAKINLQGTTAEVDGDGVQVEGTTVTIVREGVYLVNGTLGEGQLVIDTDKDTNVRVILNGVDITCTDSAPLNAKMAGTLIVTLAEGTVNSLTDGSSYIYDDEEKEEPDAALFCKNDLIINGEGSLTINANFNGGINSKDSLILVSGIYEINSAGYAIRGKDSLTVLGGSYVINAQADGLKSNNDTDSDQGWIYLANGEVDITAGEDGIQAETVLVAESGTYQIETGGGSENGEVHAETGGFGDFTGGRMGRGGAMEQPEGGEMASPEDEEAAGNTESSVSRKGIKAGSYLEIYGGTYEADSADDALHSNGDIIVSGGSLTLKTGDDGIHADGILSVKDGEIVISESYEGLEGLEVNIAGGSVTLKADDDGLNAAGDDETACMIAISGGRLKINADGDGLDSNGSIEMSGGEVYVSGPVNDGNGALDYAGECRINGGILVLAGSTGMLQTPGEDSAQNTVAVIYSERQAAGAEASLRDGQGNILVSYAPEKEYAGIQFSAEGLREGEIYSLFSGETKLGDITVSGTVTMVDETGAEAGIGGMGMRDMKGQEGMKRPEDGEMPGEIKRSEREAG